MTYLSYIYIEINSKQKHKTMKNLAEIVKQAVEAKKDGFINATRKSDGYVTHVALVWDDSEYEELFEEAVQEATRLINLSAWEIESFSLQLD